MLLDGFHLAAIARLAGSPGSGRMRGARLARVGGGAHLLRAPRLWVLGLRGCHCGRECPFSGLLGPHRSASSERSGEVRTTGKGTGAGGTGWSREPHIPPSLLAQSRSPLTWRSQKGLAIGVKAFTTLPLCIKLRPARFSKAAQCLQRGPQEVQGIYLAW